MMVTTKDMTCSLFAVFAYHMMYAALFDFRFNHIPLLKHRGFLYHAGDGHYASFYDAVFTHTHTHTHTHTQG